MAKEFDGASRALPWEGDPDFRTLMTVARRPQNDPRVYTALARQGRPSATPAERTFARSRASIYVQELVGAYVLPLALLILSLFARRPRFLAAALLALTAPDLLALDRHRATDLGPIRPLVEQSRVLGRLAALPRGTRTADPTRNLPMIVGMAPVGAYRTLDLPVVRSLTLLAQSPPSPNQDPRMAEALRATGAEVRVLDPYETVVAERSGTLPAGSETVVDRTLAGWLFGADLVAAQGEHMATFTLWWPRAATGRAWLVPLTSGRSKAILDSWSGDPAEIIALLDQARPLPVRSARPERLEIEVESSAGDGPAVVVVSQLADPTWRARWTRSNGSKPAGITPILRHPVQGATGWQSVAVPEPGRRTLTLEYPGRDVRTGLVASGLAWLLAAVVYFQLGRGTGARADSSSTKAQGEPR